MLKIKGEGGKVVGVLQDSDTEPLMVEEVKKCNCGCKEHEEDCDCEECKEGEQDADVD